MEYVDGMISVLMSVYNSEKYMKDAVESILNQTYKNFELIIIDDASTDSTPKIIKEYSLLDPRIRIFKNRINIGLTKSLNKGFKYVRGEYVARMDADDISLNDRLEKQYRYMERNKNIMLSSCSLISFGERTEKEIVDLNPKQIKAHLVFNTILPHPGFIFRSRLIQEGFKYDERLKYAQDYDFQVQVADKYDISCMKEPLIKYRVSEGQISSSKRQEQLQCANITVARQFQKFGIRLKKDEVEAIQKVYYSEYSDMSARDIITTIIILIYLKHRVKRKKTDWFKELINLCSKYEGELINEIFRRIPRAV